MPLPAAPSKRASLLSLQDYDTPASPRARQPDAPPAQVEPAVIAPTKARRPARTASANAPAAVSTQTSSQRLADLTDVPIATPIPAKPKAKRVSGPKKLFVLDTNVLLHDPSCLFRFEEHDVFLPMI